MNINLVKLYVTTFIIFAIESEKKRRSVLEQRGRKRFRAMKWINAKGKTFEM